MDKNKKAEFIRLFRAIKPECHRHTVWADFVTTSAIALHNAVNKVETLEDEYLTIINTYSNCDIQRFCEMLSIVVILLEDEPTDILGQLYMELELASKENGQYFTPSPITDCMAQLLYGDSLEQKLRQPFVTLHDPSSGSGSMILSFVKVMLQKNQNPAEKLFVSCIDVNRVAALMCYIQLSLWNVPAEVIVGNSLSMELRERWITPAYILFGWEKRLQWQKMIDGISELLGTGEENITYTSRDNELEKTDNIIETPTNSQAAFDFDLSSQ